MDMHLGHQQRSFLYLWPSFYVLHDAMRIYLGREGFSRSRYKDDP